MVPEWDAGLLVLRTVLLTVPGVFTPLSFGSLPMHKADITLKERDRTGRAEQ